VDSTHPPLLSHAPRPGRPFRHKVCVCLCLYVCVCLCLFVCVCGVCLCGLCVWLHACAKVRLHVCLYLRPCAFMYIAHPCSSSLSKQFVFIILVSEHRNVVFIHDSSLCTCISFA
jgi:hypothetical protein